MPTPESLAPAPTIRTPRRHRTYDRRPADWRRDPPQAIQMLLGYSQIVVICPPGHPRLLDLNYATKLVVVCGVASYIGVIKSTSMT